VSGADQRGTSRSRDGSWSWHWIAIPLAAILLLTPGCGTSADATDFNPGIVALPHVSYDPSIVDAIARGASYSAWIDPENEHVFDLAVWPNRKAAAHALGQYRAGGPKTYPDRSVLGTGFPYQVRKVERLKNVTLAWYRLPTQADETEVRHALRFEKAHISRRIFTALWLISGTTIDPDATAASAAALYSASLDSGPITGPLTVAIWPSTRAARRYIEGLRGLPTDVEWRQVRNVTIDTAASFGSAHISDSDVRAIRRALH
jgi:hypothetical protein